MPIRDSNPTSSFRRVAGWLPLLAACAFGCASAADTAREAAPSTSQPLAAAPAGAAYASALDAVLKDASSQTGLPVSRLKVSASESVTWLDGSLGCPDPDMMYTQALVPGFRIRIAAADRILDYHTDMRGTLVLCPPERATPAH